MVLQISNRRFIDHRRSILNPKRSFLIRRLQNLLLGYPTIYLAFLSLRDVFFCIFISASVSSLQIYANTSPLLQIYLIDLFNQLNPDLETILLGGQNLNMGLPRSTNLWFNYREIHQMDLRSSINFYEKLAIFSVKLRVLQIFSLLYHLMIYIYSRLQLTVNYLFSHLVSYEDMLS